MAHDAVGYVSVHLCVHISQYEEKSFLEREETECIYGEEVMDESRS